MSCEGSGVSLQRIGGNAVRSSGPSALGARGDWLLRNSEVEATISNIDAPFSFAPSGGVLIDLRRQGGADGLNVVLQAVGILPDDAARYHSLEPLQGEGFVALIARGALDLRPQVSVVTRYELRECDIGIRLATDLYNGGREPLTVFVSDALMSGGRGLLPFLPVKERGFHSPELELAELDAAFGKAPFVALRAHDAQHDSYSMVSCSGDRLSGFHSDTLSAMGLERRVLLPGDSVSFQRILLPGEGPGLQRAVSAALSVREQLHGEATSRVRGRVVGVLGGAVGGDERLVRLLVHELEGGHRAGGPRPWSEIVPLADGSFDLLLPADREYQLQPWVLGRATPENWSFFARGPATDVGVLEVPEVARVRVGVRGPSNQRVESEVAFVPAEPTRREDVVGTVYDRFESVECAPYLGPPHAGSPACNRVLVGREQDAVLAVLPGSYYVYASHGPFWSLDRARVELVAGETTTVELDISPLEDLPPEGVLSGDFHVHGGASFDSELPERDRVLTFAANDVDVVVATDHDVVTDYAATVRALGLSREVHVMAGIETTGDILFLRPPGSVIPRVIGHYNFWPLPFDPSLYKNGGIDDERLEPGALFDQFRELFVTPGVVQLNHPYAASSFGRDHGYFASLGVDPEASIPNAPDDTAAGQLRRRPGMGAQNIDHDVQEVMNGNGILKFLNFRRLWHSLLNQGILRAGTANSDSHTLAVEVLGYPRNLVWPPLGSSFATNMEQLDRAAFNEAVRNGQMQGTNGPVIEACIVVGSSCARPSLRALEASPGQGRLELRVRAAPWIPINEVRVIVNGQVVSTVGPGELSHPRDPFATQAVTRYVGSWQLAELESLAGIADGDYWIGVEAGYPLVSVGDVDGDGVWDVDDRNADGVISKADTSGDEFNEDYPLSHHFSQLEDDLLFHLGAVAPRTWPTAFTNPWLIDRRGDGWDAPTRP